MRTHSYTVLGCTFSNSAMSSTRRSGSTTVELVAGDVVEAVGLTVDLRTVPLLPLERVISMSNDRPVQHRQRPTSPHRDLTGVLRPLEPLAGVGKPDLFGATSQAPLPPVPYFSTDGFRMRKAPLVSVFTT